MTETKYQKLTDSSNEATAVTGQHEIEEEIELNHEVLIEDNLKNTISNSKFSKDSKIMHLAFRNLTLIIIYLSLSISLTFYQKSILEKIKYPLTIVLYHLIVKLMLTVLIRIVYKLTKNRGRVLLDWKTSLKKLSPAGMASGIDIGFSNWGLERVKISLYTMTKSTTIIFILFFAILLKLEKKSVSLIMIVVMISGGLFLFTYKYTQFDGFGFTLILFASFTSGIRWSFAQLIMQKSKLNLENPIDMIFHMQPWMILSILPFAIGIEGTRLLKFFLNIPNNSVEDILIIFTKITLGALIAFIMEISEFLVLSHTSSLTLSVAGIFKEICQLVLAVELNGDILSFVNILGLLLCLCGICCHIIHKYSSIISPKLEDTNFDLEISRTHESHHNSTVTFRKATAVTNMISNNNGQSSIPLLNSDDNDSDSDSKNDHNAAEDVIFDVLKRRDQRR